MFVIKVYAGKDRGEARVTRILVADRYPPKSKVAASVGPRVGTTFNHFAELKDFDICPNALG